LRLRVIWIIMISVSAVLLLLFLGTAMILFLPSVPAGGKDAGEFDEWAAEADIGDTMVFKGRLSSKTEAPYSDDDRLYTFKGSSTTFVGPDTLGKQGDLVYVVMGMKTTGPEVESGGPVKSMKVMCGACMIVPAIVLIAGVILFLTVKEKKRR